MFLSPALSWPIAVVVCVSVSLAGVLVLYLVARFRWGGKRPRPGTGDDAHSQMEWEDDIGLNIIVNPLDETKKSVQPMNLHNMEQTMQEYEATSSEEDDNGDEYDGHSNNEYSSEDDDDEYYENNQINPPKHGHQLEWDDEVMEYGPKTV